VLTEAKDGRASIGGVGPYPFKGSGAVVESVRENVDLGLVPIDQLAVHPDRLRRCNGHLEPSSQCTGHAGRSEFGRAPLKVCHRCGESSCCALSPRNSNIKAAEDKQAKGLALPCPAMS
jgi:hypothetical protein